jgi:hypothetical protein
MPTATRLLSEQPELQKMDHILLAVHAKIKMESVGSSLNGCMTIGISRLA